MKLCSSDNHCTITLDDANYDADVPEIIINFRLLAWYIKFEKRKALKKELNEELMLIAWDPRKWWNFACEKMKKKKKEIEPILLSNAFSVYTI